MPERQSNASSVGKRSTGQLRKPMSFAAMPVEPRGEEKRGLTMKKEYASCAGDLSRSTDTAKQNAAQADVQTVCATRIVAIRKLPPQSVYNMEVETHHNFAVNGGLIVHNCIDAVRYATENLWQKIGNSRIGTRERNPVYWK